MPTLVKFTALEYFEILQAGRLRNEKALMQLLFLEASARRDPCEDEVSHEHSEKERYITIEEDVSMRPANNRKSSSTDSDLYDESEHHILPSNPTAEVVRDSNRNLYETAPSTTLQDDNAGSTQARIKKRTRRAPLPITAVHHPASGSGSPTSKHAGEHRREELDQDLTTLDYDENDQFDYGEKSIAAKATHTITKATQTFNDNFKDLIEFKQKFYHCNAPRTSTSEYYYLGQWCHTLKESYEQKQKGQKPRIELSEENIRRLEEVGFKWRFHASKFDKRFEELMEFKQEFGHCNVKRSVRSKHFSLGRWVCRVRTSYWKFQKGENARKLVILSEEKIQRLEEAGFKWKKTPPGRSLVR